MEALGTLAWGENTNGGGKWGRVEEQKQLRRWLLGQEREERGGEGEVEHIQPPEAEGEEEEGEKEEMEDEDVKEEESEEEEEDVQAGEEMEAERGEWEGREEDELDELDALEAELEEEEWLEEGGLGVWRGGEASFPHFLLGGAPPCGFPVDCSCAPADTDPWGLLLALLAVRPGPPCLASTLPMVHLAFHVLRQQVRAVAGEGAWEELCLPFLRRAALLLTLLHSLPSLLPPGAASNNTALLAALRISPALPSLPALPEDMWTAKAWQVRAHRPCVPSSSPLLHTPPSACPPVRARSPPLLSCGCPSVPPCLPWRVCTRTCWWSGWMTAAAAAAVCPLCPPSAWCAPACSVQVAPAAGWGGRANVTRTQRKVGRGGPTWKQSRFTVHGSSG